ncbi:purine-nucleoside phosphorylase [Eubacteriales bacterium OttesenSCG-928-N13]|nr:purine-nucleoside phosphorylase [Eubacteriales bacterium OttesenSCG-928-N13]
MTDVNRYYESILAAADFIQDRIDIKPQIALVLGSGWDLLTEQIENPSKIPYQLVPGMRASGVVGHAGEFVFGSIAGKPVMVMSGRYHLYEGLTLQQVTLPIRVIKQLGVEQLILTNAAGAINTGYQPGDMMLITDHINFTCQNPLIGENDARLGDRFFDMCHVYDPRMMDCARDVAKQQGFTLQEGVYAQMTGPCYETPAEIRMLRTMGADAIGMSTVPEATVARHANLPTLGLSCMTNMAAGVLDQPLSHTEVLDTANRVRESYGKFMLDLVSKL